MTNIPNPTDSDTYILRKYLYKSGPSLARASDPNIACAEILCLPSHQQEFANRVLAGLNALAGIPTEQLVAMKPGQVQTALRVLNEQMGN